MSQCIEIEVFGQPKPQGSKKVDAIYRKGKDGKPIPVKDANGRVLTRARDDNDDLKSWRATVGEAVVHQYGGEVILGPLTLDLTFYVPRGKGHYGTGKNERVLKDSAPLYVEKVPDVLKLARGVEDALKGVLYEDDKLIHEGRYRKVWVNRWERAGCLIRAYPVESRSVADLREAAQGSLVAA